MKIELHEIPIKEIAAGFVDNDEEGVIGYGGRLDIRPKYQREFVYDKEKRDAVIHSILKGFPLNVMYWVKNGDKFEILDGQQRTVSFCRFAANMFSIRNADGNISMFCNLTETEQKQILDYKVMVYFCEGNDKEKLDWFKIINIAGEKLTDQEMRNAAYTGDWLTDAKRRFSKTGCDADRFGKDYLKGKPIRQDYLETALQWISGGKITEYMSAHQHDDDAAELWDYFESVIRWVRKVFPTVRKEMQGLEWGFYYNKHKDSALDPEKLEKRIDELVGDYDVSRKAGIYEYLLDGDERHLSIRAFTVRDKGTAYKRQKGKCAKCGQKFKLEEMEAHHIKPWHKGGKTVPENCKMLCPKCHREVHFVE